MVLVTILNWNDEANTLNLLNQISRSSKRNEIYVLVVDNGSEEYSKALLKSHEYLCDKIVFLKCNIGFSGGVNVGLKSCLDKKFDACLLLNNDIEFEGDALATLLSKERQMYDYVYGCQIFDFSDRSKLQSRGGYVRKKDLVGVNISEKRIDHLDYVVGAFMLIPAHVIKKIGLFDEGYFIYFDDLDYCKRCTELGVKLAIFEDISIYHKESAAIKKSNPKILRPSIHSHLRFIYKYQSGYRRIFMILYALTFRIVRSLAKFKFSEIFYIYKGVCDCYISIADIDKFKENRCCR